MSNFRMMPYECNSITGVCEGGFGGGGPAGYSWAVNNVPYFAGYGAPETPILIYDQYGTGKIVVPQTPVSTLAPTLESTPGAAIPVTAVGIVPTRGGQDIAQAPQAEIAGVPLLWIGAGLLAIFLLSK